MRFFHMTLLLFSALLFILGCGDGVESSEANILEPNEDFRFQNLPIQDGSSLIPPDEIPVITIQKTREDADFYYWELRASPAPTRGDLVVGVSYGDYSFIPVPVWSSTHTFLHVAILQNQNSSAEIKVPRRDSSAYSLQIESTWDTIMSMIDAWSEFLVDEIGTRTARQYHFPAVDLPPILTFDGYIIPKGFRFSYYLLGELHSLEILPKE